MTAELYSGSAARGKTKGALSAIYKFARARQERTCGLASTHILGESPSVMRIAKNKGQYLLSVSLFSFTLCKINCIAPQCRVFHKETREDKEGEGIGKKPITKYAGGKTQPKPRLFSLSSPTHDHVWILLRSTAPDHHRLDSKADSAGLAEAPTTFHGPIRIARALQARNQSSSGEICTRFQRGARE